jgi:hypothetical protein
MEISRKFSEMPKREGPIFEEEKKVGLVCHLPILVKEDRRSHFKIIF